MNNKENMVDLQRKVSRFVEERDWKSSHTPKNLAMSIAIESAELMEIFQWKSNMESEIVNDPRILEHIGEELADVMVYSQNLLDKLGLDADEIINMKMSQNEAKYPVDKAKGSAAKYDQL